MKVFYDHQAFTLQNFGGVSRIFSELLKASNNDPEFKAHLSILFSNNSHLQETKVNYSTSIQSREIIKKLNQVYNIYELSCKKYDLYHPTYYSPSLIRFAKDKPVVATFHDMIHEKFMDVFPDLKKEMKVFQDKKKLAEQATHIIAVSENTKKDLIELYSIDPAKITVIYLGSSLLKYSSVGNISEEKPYLLYVGQRFAYKNFSPFLNAVAQSLLKHNIGLICAGAKPFNSAELQLIEKLGIKKLVKQVSINDEKLASLYSNAIAFVFPSLYEGFGIPVLEAFSCNCPCVISDSSSLPEVAKDGALYFNPMELDSISASIEKIISDTILREDLVRKGQERLKNFSWNKHVAETISVYKKVT
jgi:glycosyltransferase involved in cell wall biosynthesis